MIRVHIEPDSVTLSGHAGAAPYGQDIVCAAVSVLTINLYNSIRTLTGDLVTASVTEDQTVIGWEHLSEAGRVLVADLSGRQPRGPAIRIGEVPAVGASEADVAGNVAA